MIVYFNYIKLGQVMYDMHMSQWRLSENASISRAHVQGIVEGRYNPTLPVIAKIANAVGLKISDLIMNEGVERGDIK